MSGRYKRKGGGKFVMIDRYVFQSAAWQALTPHERAAYLELKWRYNSHNNGWIGLGERELARALHSGKDTARRALGGLIAKGFVVKASPSGFNRKNRVATEWRLTEYRDDKTGEPPTKDFIRWRPSDEKTTGASQVRTGASQAHTMHRMAANYG